MRILQPKKTEIEPQTTLELDSNPGFKLKFTNLRKTAYPTNTPEKSDYFKYEIGDYITKYNAQSPIYEVIYIDRLAITDAQARGWDTKLTRYGGVSSKSSDQVATNLIVEYRKNGNFGVCQITMKPVLRGEKEVVKGKLIRFLEMDHVKSINHRSFGKVDLQAIIKNRDYSIGRLNRYVSAYEAKRDREILLKAAVVRLHQSKLTPIVVDTLVEVAA